MQVARLTLSCGLPCLPSRAADEPAATESGPLYEATIRQLACSRPVRELVLRSRTPTRRLRAHRDIEGTADQLGDLAAACSAAASPGAVARLAALSVLTLQVRQPAHRAGASHN